MSGRSKISHPIPGLDDAAVREMEKHVVGRLNVTASRPRGTKLCRQGPPRDVKHRAYRRAGTRMSDHIASSYKASSQARRVQRKNKLNSQAGRMI
jgi:hypothetical protein